MNFSPDFLDEQYYCHWLEYETSTRVRTPPLLSRPIGVQHSHTWYSFEHWCADDCYSRLSRGDSIPGESPSDLSRQWTRATFRQIKAAAATISFLSKTVGSRQSSVQMFAIFLSSQTVLCDTSSSDSRSKLLLRKDRCNERKPSDISCSPSVVHSCSLRLEQHRGHSSRANRIRSLVCLFRDQFFLLFVKRKRERKTNPFWFINPAYPWEDKHRNPPVYSMMTYCFIVLGCHCARILGMNPSEWMLMSLEDAKWQKNQWASYFFFLFKSSCSSFSRVLFQIELRI